MAINSIKGDVMEIFGVISNLYIFFSKSLGLGTEGKGSFIINFVAEQDVVLLDDSLG
jgi:hypothetical protein